MSIQAFGGGGRTGLELASNIVRSWQEEKQRERDEKRRAHIAALPQVHWIWWERDWAQRGRLIGLRWGKNAKAGEGDLIYLHHFVVRFVWSVRVYWGWPIRVDWC